MRYRKGINMTSYHIFISRIFHSQNNTKNGRCNQHYYNIQIIKISLSVEKNTSYHIVPIITNIITTCF